MSFDSQSNTSFEKISEQDKTLNSIMEQYNRYNLRLDSKQLTELTTLPTASLQGILAPLSTLDSNMEDISMWKKTLYTRILNGNPVIV